MIRVKDLCNTLQEVQGNSAWISDRLKALMANTYVKRNIIRNIFVCWSSRTVRFVYCAEGSNHTCGPAVSFKRVTSVETEIKHSSQFGLLVMHGSTEAKVIRYEKIEFLGEGQVSEAEMFTT